MFPMMIILALSSFISKRIPVAKGLSIPPLSSSSSSLSSSSSSSTTSSLLTSGTTRGITRGTSAITALQLALDSRELRFFGSSSSGSSSNGLYFNQDWVVATATAGASSLQQPVLALAGAGLENSVDDNGNSNSNGNDLNLNLSSNNSNYNLNNINLDNGVSDSSTNTNNDGKNDNNNNNNNNNINENNNQKDASVSSDADEKESPFCYLQQREHPPKRGYGPYINLSPEERELFRLIRKARDDGNLSTTLRVAGGWVRDKLLATPEFTRAGGFDNFDDDTAHGSSSGNGNKDNARMRRNGASGTPQRLTSKYNAPSSTTSSSSSTTAATSAGRLGSKVIGGGKTTKKNNNDNKNSMQRFQQQAPVDIDIALDDMLGREFAEHLNQYLSQMGEKTHGVGVVLKNPEKSKHLETATMKVGTFWIDFVNLRAEEYTQDSRIPDLMRIGTAAEDAFRRDLTINSLFYNVNNGQVEDWTGRGFEDLRRCLIATPLAPLTTLLDDPLRTLRSVRFAARLRFTMDEALVEAAMDDRVRKALAEKVSRERIGCEVDLMLRSPDPVGAMRLLINLNLARTVFPIEKLVGSVETDGDKKDLFERGLDLLSTNYNQLEDSKLYPPVWCDKSYEGSYTTHGIEDVRLFEDVLALRYMWYASFLKPLYDHSLRVEAAQPKKVITRKANRSVVCKLLVDELKRPTREAEAVEKIMKGANDFKGLMDSGCDFSAVSILLSDIRVQKQDQENDSKIKCTMNRQQVFTATENDPVWQHAMEFRLLCSKVIRKIGPLWRAALFLAMSEHITEALQGDLDYVIEGDFSDESQEDLRQREIERYDSFATAMQRIGLVGIWNQKPLMDGGEVKKVLPNIPRGPIFRDIMEEQENWMTLHPCASTDILARHLAQTFPDYV